MAKVSVYQFGIRVLLSERQAGRVDTDDTAGLEAQVMKDGMLVGFVPVIEGSEDFDEQQVIDAIWRTDYDKPIAERRTAAPPAQAPLPQEGGLFRRFLGGFRER